MKGIMSWNMYKKLKLNNLDTTSIPHVVGAVVEMEIDTGNHPPPHCIKALHPTTQALGVGAERNRNTRKSRNHRKKHIPVGITSCNSPQKEHIRRTSQKENVRGLQENKQTPA